VGFGPLAESSNQLQPLAAAWCLGLCWDTATVLVPSSNATVSGSSKVAEGFGLFERILAGAEGSLGACSGITPLPGPWPAAGWWCFWAAIQFWTVLLSPGWAYRHLTYARVGGPPGRGWNDRIAGEWGEPARAWLALARVARWWVTA